MSVEAISCAWHYSKHKGGELLVLLALADYANDDGTCWPSVKTLARKSRLTEHHVQKIIRELLASQELIRVREGSGRRSSVYAINLDQLRQFDDSNANVTQPALQGHQNEGGIADDASEAASMMPKPSGNHQKETPLKSPQGGLWVGTLKKRIGDIFNRREHTLWTKKEMAALDAICPTDDDELTMVERYYGAERHRKDNICRRDIQTLLNNWPGEVDRARAWCIRHPLKGSRTVKTAVPPAPKQSDADFQRVGELARAEMERFKKQMRKDDSGT